MIEGISLPASSTMINLFGAAPGKLVLTPDGELALTAMWEGTQPTTNQATYLPLVGVDAFRIRWIDARHSRELQAVHVGGCELIARAVGLGSVPVGFDIGGDQALRLGGLFFGSHGARVIAQSGDEAVSVSLANGTFTPMNQGRRYLGAREWRLVLIRGQLECFAADITSKVVTPA